MQYWVSWTQYNTCIFLLLLCLPVPVPSFLFVALSILTSVDVVEYLALLSKLDHFIVKIILICIEMVQLGSLKKSWKIDSYCNIECIGPHIVLVYLIFSSVCLLLCLPVSLSPLSILTAVDFVEYLPLISKLDHFIVKNNFDTHGVVYKTFWQFIMKQFSLRSNHTKNHFKIKLLTHQTWVYKVLPLTWTPTPSHALNY